MRLSFTLLFMTTFPPRFYESTSFYIIYVVKIYSYTSKTPIKLVSACNDCNNDDDSHNPNHNHNKNATRLFIRYYFFSFLFSFTLNHPVDVAVCSSILRGGFYWACRIGMLNIIIFIISISFIFA